MIKIKKNIQDKLPRTVLKWQNIDTPRIVEYTI